LFEKAIEFYEKSLTLNPELIKDCAFTLAKCYDERAKNYGGAHKLPYYQNYIKTCERYFKYVPDPFIIKFDEDEAYDQRRFEDLNLRDGHSKISKEIETL
jgi:tetratricopeptide (TPR) repeat protein